MRLIWFYWFQNPKRRAGSFIPFGAGMRLCPGIDLSKLEIAIFLHYFVHGGYRSHILNLFFLVHFFFSTRGVREIRISKTELKVQLYTSWAMFMSACLELTSFMYKMVIFFFFFFFVQTWESKPKLPRELSASAKAYRQLPCKSCKRFMNVQMKFIQNTI